MREKEERESVWLYNKTRYLSLWCIIAYMGIHQYDGKWSLPILAWQLLGVLAGSVGVKIVSTLLLLGWVYLWGVFIRGYISSVTRLLVVLIGLHAFALFSGYQQIELFGKWGYSGIHAVLYVLPYALFIAGSVLLLRRIRAQKTEHHF
jgi:hypothetical protein